MKHSSNVNPVAQETVIIVDNKVQANVNKNENLRYLRQSELIKSKKAKQYESYISKHQNQLALNYMFSILTRNKLFDEANFDKLIAHHELFFKSDTYLYLWKKLASSEQDFSQEHFNGIIRLGSVDVSPYYLINSYIYEHIILGVPETDQKSSADSLPGSRKEATSKIIDESSKVIKRAQKSAKKTNEQKNIMPAEQSAPQTTAKAQEVAETLKNMATQFPAPLSSNHFPVLTEDELKLLRKKPKEPQENHKSRKAVAQESVVALKRKADQVVPQSVKASTSSDDRLQTPAKQAKKVKCSHTDKVNKPSDSHIANSEEGLESPVRKTKKVPGKHKSRETMENESTVAPKKKSGKVAHQAVKASTSGPGFFQTSTAHTEKTNSPDAVSTNSMSISAILN